MRFLRTKNVQNLDVLVDFDQNPHFELIYAIILSVLNEEKSLNFMFPHVFFSSTCNIFYFEMISCVIAGQIVPLPYILLCVLSVIPNKIPVF